MRTIFVLTAVTSTVVTLLLSLVWKPVLWLFLIIGPLVLLGVYDMAQKRRSLLRLYPVIGHIRYMLESIRPEIQQYFIESDIDGRPISREFRSLIYQRAKGVRDTRPFGTLFDTYREGYEWLAHSISPSHIENHDLRVIYGGPDCKQPYAASPLNISAMSFGALSKTAIKALNSGAKKGGFAHNTGEGGVSPYHLEAGGDLVWQISTGYFGCRNDEGGFDAEQFTEMANLPNIKMIEIKLSQGAKPGHGGILPAAKLTEEIAAIRHVPMGKDVVSPSKHPEFSDPKGLLRFVKQLRDLSNGKPVGFKLCIGRKSEFLGICKAMVETGITPDFITVDGGEGGTGASPVELTNSVGMPLREGLSFVHSALIGFGLRDKMRLTAAGKIFSAFHMVRVMALGADTVNVARGMMLALGCIQSRSCNNDRCPTGVATQNPDRYMALDVDDKTQRVARYHQSMIEHLVELMESAGLHSVDEISPDLVMRRVDNETVKTFSELYPALKPGCLLSDDSVPQSWRTDWANASANHW
ncbi:MAG: FMN-binding glutamate synthase family protein [Proteobacteria bacterium]|nr:MAG: FMN-binding glutamate synthase family protein [Pseudomonadota bacterium]